MLLAVRTGTPSVTPLSSRFAKSVMRWSVMLLVQDSCFFLARTSNSGRRKTSSQDADTRRRRARVAASREQPRCCLSVCAPHGGQSGLEGSCTGAAKCVLSSLLRVRSSAPLDERSCALTRPSRCSSTTFSAPTPSSLPLFQPPLWRSCCSSLSQRPPGRPRQVRPGCVSLPSPDRTCAVLTGPQTLSPMRRSACRP